MLQKYKFIFIILPILTLLSCQFSKPLISYRTGKFLEKNCDSTANQIRKTYVFLSFRKYGLVGNYVIVKDYYKNGDIKKVVITKRKNSAIPVDPRIEDKFYRKEIFYSSDRKVTSLEYVTKMIKKSGRLY